MSKGGVEIPRLEQVLTRRLSHCLAAEKLGREKVGGLLVPAHRGREVVVYLKPKCSLDPGRGAKESMGSHHPRIHEREVNCALGES